MGSSVPLLVIGIALIFVGWFVQSNIFEWLLNIIGWIIIIAGIIVIVVGLYNAFTGRNRSSGRF